MSNFIGQTIRSYRLVEKIGVGGMAEVYKAYQPRLERYVALKFIRTDLIITPDFLPRFEQEARLLARLEHPHIMRIYDFGEDNDRIYLIMEYVAGGTLKEWLQTRATHDPEATLASASPPSLLTLPSSKSPHLDQPTLCV